MSDKFIANDECLPTKEVLRRQRKAEYEKMKHQRKMTKIAEKAAKQRLQQEERQKRDQDILQGLVRADQLPASDSES